VQIISERHVGVSILSSIRWRNISSWAGSVQTQCRTCKSHLNWSRSQGKELRGRASCRWTSLWSRSSMLARHPLRTGPVHAGRAPLPRTPKVKVPEGIPATPDRAYWRED